MNGPFSNALARRKTVTDLVEAREKALAGYAAAYDALAIADGALDVALLAHHAASNGKGRYNHHLDKEKLYFHKRLALSERPKYMDLARRLVDTDCWSHVIAITDLETMMDKTAKDELNQSLLQSPPEFTVENVLATLERFLLDADTIFKRGIATAFTKLDRRFKSHDGWKIGSRIILTRVFDDTGHWNYGSNHRDTFMDVERVFKLLDGNRPTHCDLSYALEQARGNKWGARQTSVETDYFRIRAWMNGNVHVWFKRDDLLEKVNQLLGEYYGAPIPEEREPDEPDPLANPKTSLAKNYGFFPTPPDAITHAFRDFSLLRRSGDPQLRILEPSAGTGNLARACIRPVTRDDAGYDWREYDRRHIVDCIEVQPALADALRESRMFNNVLTADFLQVAPRPTYDRVVMNPPFDRERDIDHVMHALKFLKPGGHLLAIMSAGTEVRSTKKSEAFRELMNSMGATWRDLPAGSFASVGTHVNTGVLTVVAGGTRGSWGGKAFRDDF